MQLHSERGAKPGVSHWLMIRRSACHMHVASAGLIYSHERSHKSRWRPTFKVWFQGCWYRLL